MNDTRLTSLLAQLADPVRKPTTYLVVTKSEHLQTNASILAHLTTAMKLEGVYVSLILSAKVLRQKLLEAGADVSKIYVIDASGSRGAQKSGDETCACASGPASLTELSILITKRMNSKPYGFFFFDSASALAATSPPDTAERFFRYLFNKMEERQLLLIVVASPSEKMDHILAAISEFADEKIEID